MASSFPPNDGVPPPQIPPNPPNHVCLTGEAISAGYKMPDESRHADAQRHGVDVTESLEREIIKQRIRAEIMAEELARRRILEEEIRIELMLEREMAMRRMESSGPRLDSYPGTSQFLHESYSIPHSLGYPEDRRLALPPTMPVHRELGFPGFEPPPFQRHPLAAPSEPRKEVVVLAKPETNISDPKRKTPISAADHHRAGYMGSEKKPRGFIGLEMNPNSVSFETADHREGLKCDMCNVHATSQIVLNEHFGGKKHKAREERRVAGGQVNGESALQSGTSPMKDREARFETTPVEKRNKKRKKHDDANSTPSSKAKASRSSKNGMSEQSPPQSTGPMKKMKFWCEMCQRGSFCPKAFAEHETGRKHLANLKRREGAASSGTTLVHGAG